MRTPLGVTLSAKLEAWFDICSKIKCRGPRNKHISPGLPVAFDELGLVRQIGVAQQALALALLQLHRLGLTLGAVPVHSSEVHLSCDP
jgi:hypothetical protein